MDSNSKLSDQENQKLLTNYQANDSQQQSPLTFDTNTQSNQMKFCEVCYMDHPINDFIPVPICGHQFCLESVKGYYTFQITQSGKFHLKCPQNMCGQEIPEDFLKQILEPEAMKKHEEFKINHEVSHDTKRIFCPVPNCAKIIHVDNTSTKKVQCDSCQNDVCFSCRSVWHEGKSCSQHQSDLYKGWAYKMDTNVCPNCKVPIEKNEGCNHMHCLHCQYHWCWICGEKLENYSHYFNPFIFVKCLEAPKTCQSKCRFHTFFICLMVFFPLLLCMKLTGVFVIHTMKFLANKLCKCKIESKAVRLLLCPCLFIYFLVLIVLIIWTCEAAALIALPFMLCPVLIWNCRRYCKINRNWSQNRRVVVSQNGGSLIENQLQQNDPSQAINNNGSISQQTQVDLENQKVDTNQNSAYQNIDEAKAPLLQN
eukprot:403360050